jgi:hypothetical protein
MPIERICLDFSRPLSTVEDLYIEHQYRELVWEDGVIEHEDAHWLELLLSFTAVKNLYLSKESAPGIAAALQELVIGGRIAEVLPSLLTIFVEGIGPWGPWGPAQERIGLFITARQLSDHPVTISVWYKDSDVESM